MGGKSCVKSMGCCLATAILLVLNKVGHDDLKFVLLMD